jgi:hypothetical protein
MVVRLRVELGDQSLNSQHLVSQLVGIIFKGKAKKNRCQGGTEQALW